MSQQLLRPLRLWPWLHFHHHPKPTLHHHHHHHLLLLLTSPPPPKTRPFSLAPLASSRGGSLRRADVPPPTTTELENRDPEAPKSRNQLKREAQRAVKWGMDLASFSPPQIKLILRVASLEQAVFDALMLVKRMGPDVREGKRRQFRYIGKLLRDVEPELMDRLIRATKDSDQRELQALTGLVSPGPVDNDNLIEIEPEEEDEEEESNWDDSQERVDRGCCAIVSPKPFRCDSCRDGCSGVSHNSFR